jgi:hypothetical protein
VYKGKPLAMKEFARQNSIMTNEAGMSFRINKRFRCARYSRLLAKAENGKSKLENGNLQDPKAAARFELPVSSFQFLISPLSSNRIKEVWGGRIAAPADFE